MKFQNGGGGVYCQDVFFNQGFHCTTVTISLQLYLKCHAHNPKNKTGRIAAAMFRESIGEWCSCAHGSVSSSDTIRSLLSHLGQSQSTEEEADADDKNSDDEESSDKVKNSTAWLESFWQ